MNTMNPESPTNSTSFFRRTEVRYAGVGIGLGLLFLLVSEMTKQVSVMQNPVFGLIGFLAWPGPIATMFMLGNRLDGGGPPMAIFALLDAVIYGGLFALIGLIVRKSGRSGRLLPTLLILGTLVLMFVLGMGVMSWLLGQA